MLREPSTVNIYPLSLHDALPILSYRVPPPRAAVQATTGTAAGEAGPQGIPLTAAEAKKLQDLLAKAQMGALRSEEHTSELQSLRHLVCRLLLEKKKITETRHDNA